MDLIANLISGFSFIAFIILIPPFVWHIRCSNIPAVSLIFWLMFSTLTGFIDAIIWGGPDFYQRYDGRGYCDITIKLQAGSSTGKLCSITGLALQLFLILRANNPAFMDPKNPRKIITDLCVCWITPIFIMAVSYIVQVQRIGILRYDGCNGFYAPSWVSLILMSVWNVVWAVAAMVAALLTLSTYYRNRRDVKDLLKCTNSGLNLKRFARLLVFSLLVTVTLLPLTIYYFIGDAKVANGPFDWNLIHHPGWNMTQYFNVDPKTLYNKYTDVGLSVIAFLIFGLGTDAVNMYKIVLIDMKFNKVFNINDPRQKDISQMSSQVRTSSNQTTKSNFTLGTGISGPTIADGIDVEFNKIINDDDDNDTDVHSGQDSKLTISHDNSKLSGDHVFTVDLEKGKDISDYLNSQDMDSKEEIDYIINMGKDDSQGINYNYYISKK